jgi:serine protease
VRDTTHLRRTIWLAAVLAVILVASSGGTGAAPQAPREAFNGREVVPGEVIVKFRTPPVRAEVDRDVDADRHEGIGAAGARRIRSRSLNTAALLARLARRADVEYVEPNYILYADNTPNDTYFNLLWGLQNTGQTIGGQVGKAGADIRAAAAWDITTGSNANVVAVVDTGIDYTHPDLAANVWSAPGAFSVTLGGVTINCAAGTHGFNAITKTCDPMDDNNHGTHVSGTIGAMGNNSIGVTGINWVASIMGAKFLDASGSGTTADAINAIEFAVQAAAKTGAQVRVLSNSWGGGGFSKALLDEINRAGAANMLFVVAAGNAGTNNDTTPSYPASYSAANLVAVAATDNTDALASFSNYGASSVDLGAPGVYIASTVRNGGYAYMSGTSMATPHVSGAAALVLSACAALDTAGLVNVLLGTVDPISSLAGKTTTGGRLNVYKAVSGCGSAPPPPPPPPPDFALSIGPSSLTVYRPGSGNYTVKVTPTNGFTGTVAFSVTGLPSRATARFTPSSLAGGSGSTVMTVTVPQNASRGTFKLTVTGKSGSLSHSASATLGVR